MENKAGVKPDPVITYLGYQLVNGKDYTVSYSSNTKPGNGIVTVTAKANFTGKLTITFEIFCSHTETTQTVKTKPTCISTGINNVKCSVCGYTWDEETPAGGHTVRVTERVEPKCTEDGYEKGKCSVCNETVTTVLPATGHNIVYHDAKAPTEDEVGWEAYETCSKCDYTTYKEIPAIFTNRATISTEQTLVGQEVTLNGIGHGGVEPYTYAFVFKAPEATSWKVIGTKFGTSDTEKLTPTKEGSYEIMITIKDGTGKSAAKKFTLDVIDGRLKNTSSIDAEGNEVPCGTKITITGAAQGGTGPYLFTYQIKKPGKATWTTIGDKYAADTSKVFTTKLSGKYEVRVLVKDSEGTVKSYSTEVESKGNLLENVSTISASDVKVGESVTLTALPKEGTAPYRYTYEYKKPGAASWKTIGKRGAAYKSVNFTTDTTGTYQARIYIQDASNYVTVKTFKVKVS